MGDVNTYTGIQTNVIVIPGVRFAIQIIENKAQEIIPKANCISLLSNQETCKNPVSLNFLDTENQNHEFKVSIASGK